MQKKRVSFRLSPLLESSVLIVVMIAIFLLTGDSSSSLLTPPSKEEASSPTPTVTPLPTPPIYTRADMTGWRTYKNTLGNFTLRYPAEFYASGLGAIHPEERGNWSTVNGLEVSNLVYAKLATLNVSYMECAEKPTVESVKKNFVTGQQSGDPSQHNDPTYLGTNTLNGLTAVYFSINEGFNADDSLCGDTNTDHGKIVSKPTIATIVLKDSSLLMLIPDPPDNASLAGVIASLSW